MSYQSKSREKFFAELGEGSIESQKPVVITVLGARAGTSALAGTLGILGCSLPSRLMSANWANTKGYFEPQDLADLHDEILASVGSKWDDFRPFPETWFQSLESELVIQKVASTYRANFGSPRLAVLKEPRMCRIIPLWLRVFDEVNVAPRFCFIDRHPFEVAQSLHARDGSSVEHGLRYYIRNHLDAERDTRGYRRTFVSYNSLLSDWRNTIERMSKRLGVPIAPTIAQASAVDLFLDRGMRHQTACASHFRNSDLVAIALDVHKAFLALQEDQLAGPIEAWLDAIRHRFGLLTQPVNTGPVE